MVPANPKFLKKMEIPMMKVAFLFLMAATLLGCGTVCKRDETANECRDRGYEPSVNTHEHDFGHHGYR